jgi:iron complex outermembrane recepter protein
VLQSAGVTGFRLLNAAAAKIKGIEVATQVKLTDQWSADLTANFQDAKYSDFLNCNASLAYDACTSPATTTNIQLSGNWLNRAPPYSGNLGVEYNLEFAGASALLLRGEVYFSGKVHFDEFSTASLTQSSYEVVNLYATYKGASDRYTVRAFAKNVGDEDYIAGGFYNSPIGETAGVWAAPLTYGAEVTFKF